MLILICQCWRLAVWVGCRWHGLPSTVTRILRCLGGFSAKGPCSSVLKQPEHLRSTSLCLCLSLSSKAGAKLKLWVELPQGNRCFASINISGHAIMSLVALVERCFCLWCLWTEARTWLGLLTDWPHLTITWPYTRMVKRQLNFITSNTCILFENNFEAMTPDH